MELVNERPIDRGEFGSLRTRGTYGSGRSTSRRRSFDTLQTEVVIDALFVSDPSRSKSDRMQ